MGERFASIKDRLYKLEKNTANGKANYLLSINSVDIGKKEIFLQVHKKGSVDVRFDGKITDSDHIVLEVLDHYELEKKELAIKWLTEKLSKEFGYSVCEQKLEFPAAKYWYYILYSYGCEEELVSRLNLVGGCK